jgi:hypothetical protein
MAKGYTYKVIAKGYMFDKIHEPHGKFNSVLTDKKLEPCPTWLKLVEGKVAPVRSGGSPPMADKIKKVKSIKDVKVPVKRKPKAKPREDLEVI